LPRVQTTANDQLGIRIYNLQKKNIISCTLADSTQNIRHLTDKDGDVTTNPRQIRVKKNASNIQEWMIVIDPNMAEFHDLKFKQFTHPT
jgi:hypothetical protein